jgi:hypothetical protein
MRFFERSEATTTVARREKKPKDYTELYRDAFKHEPDRAQEWIRFPFPWGSPEAAELQTAIWRIESRTWKTFLAKVRDEQVPGDLVEFGVSVGNSLEELIGYCEELGLAINIYGLDSFEGLPELSSSDPQFWQKGEFAADYDAVSRRLKTDVRPHVRLVKGWFSETLSDPSLNESIRKVAFARVDCDLYQSAVECLEFLESRLSDGAYLCFDDWTDNPQTGETKAFFEFYQRTKHRFVFKPLYRISLGGMHMRVYHV